MFQQEQHFFLRSLIDALPVGILILDYDDRLSEYNPEAEKMLSLRPENIGMTLHDVNPRLEEALLKIRTKGHFRFRDSPHRYYRGLINQFMHRGFARKFVILEDVSSEVLRIEKESYGKVIRMMTHEVNNSVGAINSILTSLLTDTETEETEYGEYLGIILERNKSLNQFMQNFAKVVRIPPPRPTEVSLNKLLKNVFQLMKSGSSDKDLTFQLILPENEVTSVIDRDQMEQVLINVLLNAMEAIESNGTVVAELQEDPVSIRVTDTGTGISAETAEKLFTPFFSTKPTGQGVGLTMIREILNNHGLDYSLRSADGRTVFEIRFDRVGTP